MEPTLYEKRDELRRVLQCKQFAKARKKARFLEFVAEQTFAGNAEKLNEYLIGIEVYERGNDFDPQQDAIVRVQAHEIRRSLKEYYDEEGRDHAVRIDLPAGHYVPVFARHQQAAPLDSEVAPEPQPEPAATAWQARLRVLHVSLTIALLAVCAVLIGWFVWKQKNVPPAPKPAPAAALPETMEWFWKPFLPPADPPLIVIPTHPLLRAAHDGDSAATLSHSHLIPKERLPEFRDTMHFRELKGFYFVPTLTDFTAVGETLGLLNLFEMFAGCGQKVRLKASRLADYEEMKRANSILLGGNQPWSGRVFLYTEGFWFRRGVIENRRPQGGERPVYRPEFDPVTNSLTRDYALILMLPNETRQQRILLMYGIYTQGSQAAIEYVTNGERLQELRRALVARSPDKTTVPKYFQVLLETTVENSVPGKISLVSTRIIPES